MYWYKFWKPSINKKNTKFYKEYERSYDFKK